MKPEHYLFQNVRVAGSLVQWCLIQEALAFSLDNAELAEWQENELESLRLHLVTVLENYGFPPPPGGWRPPTPDPP